MAANIIKTKRLKLRPLDMADVAEQARLIGDYEVSKWLTVVPHPYGLADARQFIGKIAGELDRAIEIDGSLAGVIGISDGLGYWLGRPFWGQGYMGEAAHAVVEDWFNAGHDCLTSGYFAGNAPSAAILGRLGFAKTKIIQEYCRAQGKKLPLQKMTLDRINWRARDA